MPRALIIGRTGLVGRCPWMPTAGTRTPMQRRASTGRSGRRSRRPVKRVLDRRPAVLIAARRGRGPPDSHGQPRRARRAGRGEAGLADPQLRRPGCTERAGDPPGGRPLPGARLDGGAWPTSGGRPAVGRTAQTLAFRPAMPGAFALRIYTQQALHIASRPLCSAHIYATATDLARPVLRIPTQSKAPPTHLGASSRPVGRAHDRGRLAGRRSQPVPAQVARPTRGAGHGGPILAAAPGQPNLLRKASMISLTCSAASICTK
jgi:hypothetical protein